MEVSKPLTVNPDILSVKQVLQYIQSSLGNTDKALEVGAGRFDGVTTIGGLLRAVANVVDEAHVTHSLYGEEATKTIQKLLHACERERDDDDDNISGRVRQSASAAQDTIASPGQEIGEVTAQAGTIQESSIATGQVSGHYRLPRELWIHVFSFLSPLDKLQAACVCREWREAISTPDIWQAVRVSTPVTSAQLLPIARYMNEGTKEVDLQVTSEPEWNREAVNAVDNAFMTALALKSPHLDRLRIQRGKVSDEGLSLIRNLSLTAFDVESEPALTPLRRPATGGSWREEDEEGLDRGGRLCQFSWRGLRFVTGPQLQRLNLRGCGINNTDLTSVAMSCPNLSDIDLSLNYSLTDEGLIALAQACGGTLTHVNLEGLHSLQGEGICNLLQLSVRGLECLLLTQCVQATDQAIAPLSDPLCRSAQTLKTLSLNGCPLLSTECLRHTFTHLHHLENVNLMHVRNVTDDVIISWARSPPVFLSSLVTVRLGCTSVTDKGLLALLAATVVSRESEGSRLHELYLQDLPVTHKSLTMMKDMFPEVRKVILRGCHNVDNASLRTLVQHCPKVQEIDVMMTDVDYDTFQWAQTILREQERDVRLHWFQQARPYLEVPEIVSIDSPIKSPPPNVEVTGQA